MGTSAWYAPGASVVEMVEAILLDKHKILPCSVFLQGEYGVRDLFVGVPCKLGARGLEKIIEIKLTPDEDAAFKKSAAAVKELVGSRSLGAAGIGALDLAGSAARDKIRVCLVL